MALYYNHNNVTISVNNQSILADSVAFTVDTQLGEKTLLGKRGDFSLVADQGVKATVDISYYLAGSDPLKPFLTNDLSVPFEVAGLTLTEGYINSYSLAVNPSGPVKISASLNFYEDFDDNFSPATLPDEERDYLSLADVSLTLAGVDASSKVRSLSYAMSPEFEESYEAGGLTPASIRHGKKATTLSMETYNFREALLYSGKDISTSFTIGPETYEIFGTLHAKNVNFVVGEKITSSLSIRSNSYGGAAVLRESNTSSQKSAGEKWNIYGNNLLDTTAIYFNNNIKVNKFTTHVTTGSDLPLGDSYIAITIPRFARSGRIRVITPHGEAAHDQRPNRPYIIANINPSFIP